REIVVEHERLLVDARNRVYLLLVFRSAQRNGSQNLRFTAGKEPGAMHSRKQTRFTTNGTNGIVGAAIDTRLRVQRQFACVSGLQVLEIQTHELVARLIVLTRWLGNAELFLHLFFHGTERFVTRQLFANRKRLLEERKDR